MSSIWSGLDALLRTDPGDVGCEDTWQLINAYAEVARAGGNPETTYPGITAHLDSCDPCAEDYRGLLEAMRRSVQSRTAADN